MKAEDLKSRTKRFALNIIRFCSHLPNRPEYWVITRQLTRSGTSVGANYRAACRGKSKADFIAKLGIVEEEADESRYRLELLDEICTEEKEEIRRLMREAGELTAIIVQSRKTARKNQQR